ncbi:hypothetical protein E1I69_22600 [Bacillus timonensis]|uniref:Uncharacterized protein n=1 Tax=Bacillus timonensis TaxID=1033734 RepID=A0A4S3PK78_9BACI|nr:hypothetical protein [Bacillus timonensis]THE09375.1 hypothetical protein E1I69_22600 [Bacillus timonensis]
MELQKITLMDAYMIETLRSNGISNNEILAQIEQGNVDGWQDLHEHFDFNELLKLAEQDIRSFRSILLEGYKVKYVTFKGLQNLIKLRFGKVKDKDYQLTETSIENLKLNEDQALTLKQMISQNWIFSWDGGTGSLSHR